MAADSKLVVSLVVGKRTQAQTNALVHDANRRLRARHLPAIFTDACNGYEPVILEAFGVVTLLPAAPGKAEHLVSSSAGPKDWLMAR